MAELVGIISGGAGLASLSLQLMETAVKLKALAKAYKNAPRSLERTAFEIETFGLVLQEMERDRLAHDSADGDLLSRCILMCQQSVEQIRLATEKLESMIGRMKFIGRLMTALDEKETSQIFQELERAKSALGLAHDMYLEVRRAARSQLSLATSRDIRAILVEQQLVIRLQSQDIMELKSGMEALTATVAATSFSRHERRIGPSEEFEQQGVPISKRSSPCPNKKWKKRGQRDSWAFKLNPWFLSKIWNISMERTPSGWNLNLQTWNLRRSDSVIFSLCRWGDLISVRTLIDSGEASFYDVNEKGNTLIGQALFWGHSELLRYLLQHTEIWAVLEILDTSGYAFHKRDHGGGERQRIGSLVFHSTDLSYSDRIADQNFSEFGSWWCSLGHDPALWDMALSTMSEPWNSRPLATRFEAARLGRHDSSCSTFRLALGPCSLKDLAELRDSEGSTVLHFVAEAFNRSELGPEWRPMMVNMIESGAHPEWRQLMVDMIKSGADLHAADRRGWTPLSILLFDRHVTDLMPTLEFWLEILLKAGVNLVQYGCDLREGTFKEFCFNLCGHDVSFNFKVENVLIGDFISEWDVTGYVRSKISVWSPYEVPGQWAPTTRDCSLLLPWEPTAEDQYALLGESATSRIWDRHFMELWSAPSSFRSLSVNRDFYPDTRLEIEKQSHDDLDLTMFSRERWRSSRQRRSRSQPADVRSSIHLDDRKSPVVRWCRLSLHRCRLDSRWRLCKEVKTGSQDDRNCMAGCPFNFESFVNDIFTSSHWTQIRRRERVGDYWSTEYGDQSHDYDIVVYYDQ